LLKKITENNLNKPICARARSFGIGNARKPFIDFTGLFIAVFC